MTTKTIVDTILDTNTVVFHGASDSPKLVVVKDYSDTHVAIHEVDEDSVYDVTPELGSMWLEDRRVAEDLIARGTRTWLASGMAKYFPEVADELRALVG